MKTFFLSAATALAIATQGALVAQGLLYTTNQPETSTQCPPLPGITTVAVNDIEHIVPAIPPAWPGAFQTRQACEVMWGDQDGDGSFAEPTLFGRIDALLPPFHVGGGAIQPNGRNVWFSPEVQTTALVGAPLLHEAELGRMLPNGVLEEFINRAQVYAAFGLPAAAQANIDAAAMVWNVGLFLSFENAVNINTAFNGMVAGVPDGAILAIPFNSIVWAASAYDGAAVVANVVAGSGVIVLGEPQVDALVAASGIRDNAGVPVMAIGDTDGLEADPQGGMFFSQGLVEHQQFPGGMVPNLIFCGQNLTGGGIVSTSGNIAVVNGVPMGNAAGATTGADLGLVTAGGVGSLNGLGLTGVVQPRFVTACTSRLLAPGNINFEVAADPGGVVLFALQHLPPPASGIFPCVGLGFAGFPDAYLLPPTPHGGVVAGGWFAPTPIAVPPPVWALAAGSVLLVQALHLTAGGALELSTPSVCQLY